MRTLGLLAIIMTGLVDQRLAAQPAEEAATGFHPPSMRSVTAHAVVAVTYVPYCVDMLWQVPSGGRVGWVTASVANPDPLRANGRVFLLRGTGTVFTPGFGEICTRLRRAGIWAEDLGPAGDGWVCRHLISEHRAGRLRGPVVLVGHSRGARHIVDAAHALERAGISVDLLVCLDVTLPARVPGNVRQALNVYMSRGRFYPADPLLPAAGSMASIENVDLSSPGAPVVGHGLHHLNLTANPAVQEFVVARILQAANESPRP
jgi:hypothetical protein